jgi:hypothetical protein
MHENREISCTSWPSDQDRSAKAINRTADMNVQEKSDCAVLPLNRPNKEVQASAEVGEGRAQTGENIVQSHMPPTQSGQSMSLGLCGVRQAATERKQERFTALLHHLNVTLHHSLLNDFVLQCCDAQRTLPPISLRDVHSPRRSCPVRSTVHPAVKIGQPTFQPAFICPHRAPSSLASGGCPHAARPAPDAGCDWAGIRKKSL